MAKVIYQPVAGRLRIGGRDYSLEDLVMDWILANDGSTYLISIESGVRGTGVRNTPLSEIEDNVGGTYANIAAWLAWWEALETMGDLTATITGGATEAKQDTLIGKQFPNVGIHILTGTGAAPAGTYTGLLVLEEATISSITLTDSAKVTGTDDFSGITLSVGTFLEIPGGFSTVTLSAGSMVLVKGA
jgi:hypothetical protein